MASEQDDLAALRAQVAALTARVHKLEQQAGVDPISAPGIPAPRPPVSPAPQIAVPDSATTPPRPTIPPPPPPPKAPSFPSIRSNMGNNQGRAKSSDDLEGQIGKLWLNRIGVAAILIGVAYFLKYAFDSQWIGPGGRIALGLMSGIAVIVLSEIVRRQGQAAFSYSLKAVGIGVLYLSLWGAFQIYHLIPAELAFTAMLLVTLFTVILAFTQDAEILAAFAIIGGFSTPVLLSTGTNAEVFLFSYVGLLDLGMLALVFFKPWRRLLWGSFVGTLILYLGWYFTYYRLAERDTTVAFTLLFAGIFAVVPLVTPLTRSRWHQGFSITLTVLPLLNAAFVFLALYAMYDRELVTLTWYSLAFAAVYLGLSSQFKRRVTSEPDVVKLVNLIHIAIAIAFITIAIPLKLDAHWITLGWLIESAVLLAIAVRTRTDFLRYFAGTTLALGIFRLLALDNFHVDTLIFNARFATYLVAIAILGGIVWAADRSASDRERPIVRIAAIALNLLALWALTLEADSYFGRELAQWNAAHHRATNYLGYQQIQFARNLSYSVIWLLYGAGLMLFGFWKRSVFVRWQAIVLLAVTIGKVFVFDTSNLQEGYRILSFIALGVVLMGMSYIYHLSSRRLKLTDSRKTPANTINP
jgi:uncharacterized membrane protein